MAGDIETLGTIEVLGHCRFSWRESASRGWRSIEVTAAHCATCVVELRRIGPRWRLVPATEPLPIISGPALTPTPVDPQEHDGYLDEVMERVLQSPRKA